jgi:hypothetical protein
VKLSMQVSTTARSLSSERTRLATLEMELEKVHTLVTRILGRVTARDRKAEASSPGDGATLTKDELRARALRPGMVVRGN